jgi:predicted PurR-regulated permease PerM
MNIPEKNFNISTGVIVKTLVVLLIAFLLYQMLDLVLVVLTAVVIASAVEPLINWFHQYRVKRIFAVIITYLCIVIVFSGLLYFFIPPVLKEASNLLSNAPKYLDSITLWNPLNDKNITQTGKIVGGISDGLNSGKQIIDSLPSGNVETSGLSSLITRIQSFASNSSDSIINIASGIFGGVFSFILIIVLSFYLAVQEGGVEKFLKIITPVKNEVYIIDLWKRSQKKIGYWMQGQLLLCVLVGVLTYLGLTILGIQNALVLAVITGCLEIIPLFGPILSAIPAILFGFTGGGLTMALIVLGLFVIIHQFENHLLYPLVVKKVIGVSPIIIILSLIIGGKLAGFLGIILSVPIASALMEFIDDVQKDKGTANKMLDSIS